MDVFYRSLHPQAPGNLQVEMMKAQLINRPDSNQCLGPLSLNYDLSLHSKRKRLANLHEDQFRDQEAHAQIPSRREPINLSGVTLLRQVAPQSRNNLYLSIKLTIRQTCQRIHLLQARQLN